MRLTMKKISYQASLALAISAGAMLATTTLGAGCAEPELIDRVQPDLIRKADLAGEWYTLTTVTRTPFAAQDEFVGLQGLVERGIWDVQKDYAYFFRTYDAVEGAEGQGIRADVDTVLLDKNGKPVTYDQKLADGTIHKVTRYVFRSAPIKKFPISGHYDVRKSYNPLTGEESNVRVEDGSEKFWYQREFMRVDFGSNSAQDYADLSFGDTSWATATIYDGEAGAPDLKLRVQDDGAYMDYVVRGFVLAPSTYLDGWGQVPTCLFYPWYTGAYYECDEEEHHMRTSYMKVKDGNTYQAEDWNDNMLNKFGYYRTARSNYDQYFGETFSGADRFIRRFRVWKDYVVDAAGELDYAKMEPAPIVYYLSENFPRELIRGAKDLAVQWNVPFKDVIENRLGKPYDGPMFVLCENNTGEVAAIKAANPDAVLAETDAKYCKDMASPKVVGDLRYNLLVSINDPVQYGLYGYGPMHADPLTGETIHANAFLYTANVHLGARNAVDMIEYEAGVQSFTDITQARNIETALKAKAVKGTQGAPRKSHDGSLESLQIEAGQVVPLDVGADLAATGFQTTDVDIAQAQMNRLLDTDEFDALWLNSDMAALAGLPVTQLGQVTGPDAAKLRDVVHPSNLASENMLKFKMEKDLAHGQQAICMREFFDDSFRGLALEYKAKYDKAVCEGLKAKADGGADFAFDFKAFDEPHQACDADASVCGANEECRFLDQGDVQGKFCVASCSAGALFDQLRKEIRRVNQINQFVYWDPNALYTDTKDARVSASQLAARAIVEQMRNDVYLEVFDKMWSTVAMHEVGHNLGLRHNFASSTDALNFFPDYWGLKGHGDGAAWQADALFTDDTDTQTRAKMREYQQTSIMEYSSSFNARNQGIGSYDRAAILYGYGDLVEVFSHPPAFADWSKYLAEPSDSMPDQFPIEQRRVGPLAFALTKVHHTNYPKLFGGVANILDRKIVDIRALRDESKPCKVDDGPYDWSVCGVEGSFCTPYPDGYFCSKPDMVEVPFRFCSDEYNNRTPLCATWDEGTDVFEIINNAISDYDAYWPFRAYRRDNDLFNPMTSYYGGVMYNMYGYRKQFEHWALGYARYNHSDWWEKQYGTPWHLDPNGGLGATIASKKIFEHMANIFGRPSDSYYGFNQQRQVYEPLVDNGRNTYSNVFQVREDMGARPIYPSYDYDGYLYVPYRAGTFYDRMAALMYMTYPVSMFTVAVDKAYDQKRFRFNFASIWPQRVQNLLSGVIAGAPNLFGWCIEHDGVSPTEGGTGDPIRVKPRMWFGTKADLDAYYENCTPLNPEPQYDFPTTQYRLPALAAIYGYGWMSNTYDRTFIDRGRLWLKGDGTDIEVQPNFETIEYTDPFSGKTYVASYDPAEEDPYAEISPRDAVPDEDIEHPRAAFWPAARLLALCNQEVAQYGGNMSDLAADYHYSRLQETVGRLEILRGLYRHFDFGF